MYTTSQDHLELFFGTIQSLGGNCIPLENIDILLYSSSDSIKTINNSTNSHNTDSILSEKNVQECDKCLKALYSNDKESLLNSLITLKNKEGDKGGLNYPSDDVIIICLQTEKILKSFNYENLLYHFYNSNIFSSLESHSLECNSPLTDHVTLLIKSISSTYIKLRINYNLKSHNDNPSLRMWYNKLTLFRGQ
ncbi:hypothetical protein AGLY_007390 [Aphis glycines]|uniref:Transposable element P transposase-like RNase H C-terminal domain-containing protein n=1 Tax=Aphis glycines TaxID=307491 RepID=A0A6G0TNH3_APHGL|nr:hypothetical protein AGLY_007390 [Aphis glycines]